MKRNRARVKQAPLDPQGLIGPGFLGLNTERATTAGYESPNWALKLRNVVFDTEGFVSQRKGYTVETTTPMTNTPTVWKLHEHYQADQTTQLIAASYRAGPVIEFWMSADDGVTWSSITGSVSSTTVRWKFVTLDDITFATAPGHRVYKYTGAGNLTEIAGSPVTNGTIIAAYGRLWVGVDGTATVDYSGILDGEDWSGAGSGTLDLSKVWTQGQDTPVALGAFGATFVVFGARHVVLYVDGSGSVQGIDPDNMYVVDTIEGTGAISADAVVNIGEGDLWFVSQYGVQSLSRVIQEKVNPMVDVTENIAGYWKSLIVGEVGSIGNVQALYSTKEKFALFLFQEQSLLVLIDTKQWKSGIYRIATWHDLPYFSLLHRRNGDLFFGLAGGEVAKYDTYRDDGVAFSVIYGSPWLDFGKHNQLKIVKQFYALFYGRETLTATARWGFDFQPFSYTETFANDYVSVGGEYGIGEYGIDEYGTGHRVRRQYVGGMGEGFTVALEVEVESTDVDARVGILEIGSIAKIGRAG